MTMLKAVKIRRFGGPEVLSVEDLACPRPQDDEVLVKVAAAGVNPVDSKIRSGKYPDVREDNLPVVLGREVSGTIAVCGRRADGLEPGDPVFAMLGLGRGGYAEYVIVKTSETVAKPGRLDHVRAAAVPLAGLTAWQGLFDQGGLKAGQRVLIHGGAGGVGHFAIQFAKAKGAWVATTVSRGDFDFVRALGADQAIDYRHERFEEALGGQVDLVFDLIAGETQERSWAVLKSGGVLVSTLTKPSEEVAARHGVRSTRFTVQPNAAELAEIARLIEDGKVRVIVESTFPLAEAAAAQIHLERDHVRGKIVLTVAA
jgi:NADPH:quinone reductase-like Zn-dependent oxidoreductase